MKNLIIICVFGVIWAISTSCEKMMGNFLEKAPGVDVTEDSVFASLANVETFVAGMYRFGIHTGFGYLDYMAGQNRALEAGYCDEGVQGATYHSVKQWNAGAVTADGVTIMGIAGGCEDYRVNIRPGAIRRCNILLERIDATSLDQSYKDQVKGEAKFIRALNYFEMFKRYGGVPIVDKRFQLTDNLKVPRSSVEDVVNFIVKDCDDAAAVLPDSYAPTLRGRATRGAALALKAKTLLFAASPLFNTGAPYLDLGENNKLICYGNFDNTRWQKAADAAKAVIDWAPSGGCALITNQGSTKNYRYAWEKNDNAEIILAEKGHGGYNGSIAQYIGFFQNFIPTHVYNGDGGVSIPLQFVKFYEKKDGTPQTWDPVGGNDLNQKYSELDPRFAQTMAYNGSYFTADYPQIQIYQGGAHTDFCWGGCWLLKWVPGTLTWTVAATQNWPLFRLGEAYLNYAEALNEAQGPVQAAYDAVNIIRQRSGMPNLPAGLTKEGFRTRVRNERAIELAYEGHRFWDIRRWLIAENDGVMKGNMYGIKIYKIANSSEYRYEPYVFEVRVFTPKMYLHPFLDTEVYKGYIVQNPGY